MARNGERSGTFKSERSNALERIVENGHGPNTKELLYKIFKNQIKYNFSSKLPQLFIQHDNKDDY
jgi:hypothetical protein